MGGVEQVQGVGRHRGGLRKGRVGRNIGGVEGEREGFKDVGVGVGVVVRGDGAFILNNSDNDKTTRQLSSRNAIRLRDISSVLPPGVLGFFMMHPCAFHFVSSMCDGVSCLVKCYQHADCTSVTQDATKCADLF